MNRSLPSELMRAVSHEIQAFSTAELSASAQFLSSSYRSREHIQHTLSPLERAAYLAVRFPSTYSVACHVWQEVFARVGTTQCQTVLDVGAGPGTASLALLEQTDSVQATLLERDTGWKQTAQALALSLESKPAFVAGSIEGRILTQRHDAVVACYALNELPSNTLASVAQHLWGLCAQVLVIIEPGTPLGFEVVRRVRDIVLGQGGHVIAPCTHDLPCPMQDRDWCHTALRVQRSELHRRIKGAALSFEDEKYSYVAMSRVPLGAHAFGRIVRKPIQAKGHVHLDICRDGKIERVTYSKRQKDLYAAAKDCAWGDLAPDQTGRAL